MVIWQLAVTIENLEHQAGVPLKESVLLVGAAFQFLTRGRLLKRKIHAHKSGSKSVR